MSNILKLALDVLKPHQPSIVEVARRLSSLSGVTGVSCILDEVDQDTESVMIIIEGDDIDFDTVEETIEACGGAIHSIDNVSAGGKIVEDHRRHHQD